MSEHPDAYSTVTRCEVEVKTALLTFITIFLDSGVPVERLRRDVREFAAQGEVWDALARIERNRAVELAAFEAGEDDPHDAGGDADDDDGDGDDGRLSS